MIVIDLSAHLRAARIADILRFTGRFSNRLEAAAGGNGPSDERPSSVARAEATSG
jgi:hypothetical protein